MLQVVFLLFLALALHTPVFFNTNPVFLNTNPTPTNTLFTNFNTLTNMDIHREAQFPADNQLAIPMSVWYHHAAMDSMSTTFNFHQARELEKLKDKQEKFYAQRHARIEKQKAKLDACTELPECCHR